MEAKEMDSRAVITTYIESRLKNTFACTPMVYTDTFLGDMYNDHPVIAYLRRLANKHMTHVGVQNIADSFKAKRHLIQQGLPTTSVRDAYIRLLTTAFFAKRGPLANPNYTWHRVTMAIEITAQLCEEAIVMGNEPRVREFIEWLLYVFKYWAVDTWIHNNGGWAQISSKRKQPSSGSRIVKASLTKPEMYMAADQHRGDIAKDCGTKAERPRANSPSRSMEATSPVESAQPRRDFIRVNLSTLPQYNAPPPRSVASLDDKVAKPAYTTPRTPCSQAGSVEVGSVGSSQLPCTSTLPEAYGSVGKPAPTATHNLYNAPSIKPNSQAMPNSATPCASGPQPAMEIRPPPPCYKEVAQSSVASQSYGMQPQHFNPSAVPYYNTAPRLPAAQPEIYGQLVQPNYMQPLSMNTGTSAIHNPPAPPNAPPQPYFLSYRPPGASVNHAMYINPPAYRQPPTVPTTNYMRGAQSMPVNQQPLSLPIPSRQLFRTADGPCTAQVASGPINQQAPKSPKPRDEEYEKRLKKYISSLMFSDPPDKKSLYKYLSSLKPSQPAYDPLKSANNDKKIDRGHRPVSQCSPNRSTFKESTAADNICDEDDKGDSTYPCMPNIEALPSMENTSRPRRMTPSSSKNKPPSEVRVESMRSWDFPAKDITDPKKLCDSDNDDEFENPPEQEPLYRSFGKERDWASNPYNNDDEGWTTTSDTEENWSPNGFDAQREKEDCRSPFDPLEWSRLNPDQVGNVRGYM